MAALNRVPQTATDKDMQMLTYTTEQLDMELLRRRAFPPFSLRGMREEWVTVAKLRGELEGTPLTHPDRDWREWELALAERQAQGHPRKRFYRIVSDNTASVSSTKGQ